MKILADFQICIIYAAIAALSMLQSMLLICTESWHKCSLLSEVPKCKKKYENCPKIAKVGAFFSENLHFSGKKHFL